MISIKKIGRTIIELVFNNGNTIVRDDIRMDELNGIKL